MNKINYILFNKQGKLSKALLFVVILWTLVLYLNSVNNDFTYWDDPRYVTENIEIRDLSYSSVINFFSSYSDYYQPLVYLSYAIEYHFFGLNPHVFHATNIIIHLLNVALVFLIIYAFDKRNFVAAFVALLFGIHPFHVESVAWITERKDVLFTFFYLLSYLFYLKFLTKEKKWIFYIISLITFILSVISKPAAITLPFIIVITDLYNKRKFNKVLLLEKLPFLMISVIFGIILMYFGIKQDYITDLENIYTIAQRIFMTFYAIVFYLFSFLFPLKQSVIHYYPNLNEGYLSIKYYLSPLVLLALGYIYYKSKKFKRELAFGFLFFMFTISILLQIIPSFVALVAERYTYIPYIGLSFSIGIIVSSIFEKKEIRFNIKLLAGILTFAFLIFFSIKTINRLKVWKNGLSLMKDLVSKYPEGHLGYLGLGNAYDKQGNFTEAFRNYEKAVEMHNTHYLSYFNRGDARFKLKDYQGALKDFETSRDLKPGYTRTYNNLGVVKNVLGDYDGAFLDLKKAIELDAKNYEAYYNLGNLYGKVNQFDSAIWSYNKAIGLNPYYYEAFLHRGNAYINKLDFQKAYDNYSIALKLKPTSSLAMYNRGSAKFYMNDISSACLDWLMAYKAGYQPAGKLLYANCKDLMLENNINKKTKYDVLDERYENNQKKYDIKVDVSSSDTVEKFIHYNFYGVVIEEGQIENGRYKGYVKWFYDDGSLKTKGYLNDTIPYGHWEDYYPNGNLKSSYQYKNGVKNGSYKYFFENGNLWTEREYKNGKLWNIVSNFDISGNIKEKGTLVNGNGILYEYNKDGSLIHKISYINGKQSKSN